MKGNVSAPPLVLVLGVAYSSSHVIAKGVAEEKKNKHTLTKPLLHSSGGMIRNTATVGHEVIIPVRLLARGEPLKGGIILHVGCACRKWEGPEKKFDQRINLKQKRRD